MPTYRRKYPAITYSKTKGLYRATMPIGGKRKDVYGKTKEDVMDRIDEIMDEQEGGTITAAVTLGEYAQRWVALKVRDLRPTTKAAYANSLTNHILPAMGHMALSEIKPLHVDELMSGLSGKSSALCVKVLNTLSQIMESAIENDIIPKNPCRGRKPGGEKTKPKTPLSREQQEALCSAVSGTRAEPG